MTMRERMALAIFTAQQQTNDLLQVADAVLDAMREPPEEAQRRAWNTDLIGFDPDPLVAWQSMIAAAKEER